MSQYMIHTCPKRKWYVDEFLIPSMLEQGIRHEDINVYNDIDGDGHLMSFMNSWKWLREDGTWHLQDDIIISSDFKRKTEVYDEGVVCGFVNSYSEFASETGYVPVEKMWYSMPCIRIPNDIMKELVVWFVTSGVQERYKTHIRNRKHSDVILWDFLKERHPGMIVLHLAPNIINHIDHLIGGSLINEKRTKGPKEIMSLYWTEDCLITQLEKELEYRNICYN